MKLFQIVIQKEKISENIGGGVICQKVLPAWKNCDILKLNEA